MVHFWATWCPPCVDEIPTLERLNRSFVGKDLCYPCRERRRGRAGAVGQFMQRNGFTLPVLLNPDQSAARAYGTFNSPRDLSP